MNNILNSNAIALATSKLKKNTNIMATSLYFGFFLVKKIKIWILIAGLLSFEVFADFTTLSTEQVQAKIDQGVAIIDIRRQDEYAKYGVIPNAHKLTFFDDKGRYNTKKWLSELSKIIKTKDTPFILVCAHANRTKTIGNFLNTKTNYKNIFELDGGINNGWIAKGLKTSKHNKFK